MMIDGATESAQFDYAIVVDKSARSRAQMDEIKARCAAAEKAAREPALKGTKIPVCTAAEVLARARAGKKPRWSDKDDVHSDSGRSGP